MWGGGGGAGHLHYVRILELMVCLFTVVGSWPLPQGRGLTQLGQKQDPEIMVRAGLCDNGMLLPGRSLE